MLRFSINLPMNPCIQLFLNNDIQQLAIKCGDNELYSIIKSPKEKYETEGERTQTSTNIRGKMRCPGGVSIF